MQVTLRVILVSGIGVLFQCGCVFAVPVSLHHIISKDLLDTEEYNSYISISNNRGDSSNNELNVISQLDQLYLDNRDSQVISTGRPQQLKETAYLLVKTIRQRDKRYISWVEVILPDGIMSSGYLKCQNYSN